MEQFLLNKLINLSELPCQIIHQYLHKSPRYSSCKSCNKNVCKQCTRYLKNCDKHSCSSDCYSCYKDKHVKCEIHWCSYDSCMSLCKFCSRYFCDEHGNQCRKCNINTCFHCTQKCIDRIINDHYNNSILSKARRDQHVHCQECYSSLVIQCNECKTLGCCVFLSIYKCSFCEKSKYKCCIYGQKKNGNTYDILCVECSTQKSCLVRCHYKFYKQYRNR